MAEVRKTFVIPEGYEAGRDAEGRATGEVHLIGGVKHDGTKLPLHLIAPDFLYAIAEILDFGAKKYAPRNWEKGMDWSRVYRAAIGHLFDWWMRKGPDPETGKSHLWHAGCCIMFLVCYELRAVGTDDRPGTTAKADVGLEIKPLAGDPKFEERLKAAVKSLDEMPRNAMSPEEQMDTIDKLFAPEGPRFKVTYDLSFGQALNWLKLGRRVARSGWNGKGMWLVMVDPKTTTVAKFGAGPTEYVGNAMLDNGTYPILPWIGMKTADDKFVPWPASQTDLLAIDWGVLE